MQSFKFIYSFLIILCLFSFSCKTEKKEASQESLPITQEVTKANESLRHAKKFSIEKNGDVTLITVFSPWPDADQNFTYALLPREKAAAITLNRDAYDAIVLTPVERVVVTSTTHIPTKILVRTIK